MAPFQLTPRGCHADLWEESRSSQKPVIQTLLGQLHVLRDQQHAISALCPREGLITCCSCLQCYLKDAAARIETDMQRASAEGWRFGAKTVRGAYMVVERARAAERGYDSPIWDTLQETHDSYNRQASDRAWLKLVSHMRMRKCLIAAYEKWQPCCDHTA